MTKILVIDDSSLMRFMVREALEAAGFEVEDWMPLSPMEIGDRIEATKPDLVLTDYVMPGVNGLSVVKMVQRANPGIPILVLTALRDPEITASLLKFGAKRVLHKPINMDALIGAIQELLPTPS